MTRQSPSSSRKRSTTNVVSVGTVPVASRCSSISCHRLSVAKSLKPIVRQRSSNSCAAQPGQLAGERADRRAQLGGPADAVAAPERQPGGLAGRGEDQHAVVGDLGDPPAGRAERDDVARPRLVDHLLVEFADARGLVGVRARGQVHREQPAVGDRAAGGDRQPLRAGPGGQRARVAVVHQPRPQLGELGRRVLAAQQVERGLEGAARQRGERCAAPHRVEPAVGVERFERRGGDGVLRQHVERVGRHLHGLDLAGQHALHRHRAVDQIGAVLGEQHALRDLADLVARAADALQTAGHRRRRLHLDDEVDRAHVDAEFEAGGGDDGLEPAGLEVVLDHARAVPC